MPPAIPQEMSFASEIDLRKFATKRTSEREGAKVALGVERSEATSFD
jgi:hypothetical protein